MFNPYLPTTICHWHWHWHCLGKIGSNIASTTSATCGSPIVQNGSISFSSLAVTVGSVLVSRSSPPLYYALMRTPSLETWVTDFCGHLLLTCHELRKLNLILQASTMISVSHLGPSFVSLIPSPGASCSSNPRRETRVSRPKRIRLLLPPSPPAIPSQVPSCHGLAGLCPWSCLRLRRY